MTWGALAAFLVLLTTVAALVDFWAGRSRDAKPWHDAMINWWCVLETTRPRDLVSLTARQSLRFGRWLLGNRWPRRVLIAIVASVLLTSGALALAMEIALNNLGVPFVLVMASIIRSGFLWTTFSQLFAVNFVFDLATVAITIHALRRIAKGVGIFKGLAWCSFDIVAALALAIARAQSLKLFPSSSTPDCCREVGAVLTAAPSVDDLALFVVAMYASTTFVPTLCYMAVFLAMFVARPVWLTMRWTLKQYLQVVIVDKFAPMTPVALTLAILAAGTKLVAEIMMVN